MDRRAFSAVFCAVFAVMLHSAAAQRVHIVGDGMGWDIPHNSSVSYANWASGKTFLVGDTLVFNFMTNQHDVVRVPEASYDECTQDNAIGNIITTGPANITLDSTGEHYYICTFGRHCAAGQKLAITVGSSGTPGGANPPMTTPPPATPSTPTTPSPASPQPDACAPTPPPSTPNAAGPTAAPAQPAGPPPPDSASTSLAAGSFLLLLLSAAMVLMF